MSFCGYREDTRGEWLGKPVGLGYEKIEDKLIVYMIQQNEQVIIKIENQEQTKPFIAFPMVLLDRDTIEWLMDESKSGLKPFYGIEEYKEYIDEEFKKLMEETEDIEEDEIL